MGDKDKSSIASYLARIVIIFVLIGLIVIWTLITDGFLSAQTWIELLKGIIPNFIGPLFSIIILYFLFFRRGIDIENIAKSGSTDWLNKGYETFDQIDWNPYIRSSNKLVIVAFFFDEWITTYSKSFEVFLKNSNSMLVVYLPNYKNENLLKEIHKIIPEYTPEQLSIKIINSIYELQRRSKSHTQNVSIKLYNYVFNYTYQIFDQLMFLQINELDRQAAYKSPFFVLNLEKSTTVNAFVNGETAVLEEKSEGLNLVTWKR